MADVDLATMWEDFVIGRLGLHQLPPELMSIYDCGFMDGVGSVQPLVRDLERVVYAQREARATVANTLARADVIDFRRSTAKRRAS